MGENGDQMDGIYKIPLFFFLDCSSSMKYVDHLWISGGRTRILPQLRPDIPETHYLSALAFSYGPKSEA